ncbi:MAG: hypothetical protein E7623_04180, partial [Ruminococcaceae bacterium]|nr:hypothetical protein [Oscillospiraceae bacterium]
MKHSYFTKILAMVLAVITVLGTMSVAVLAEEDQVLSADTVLSDADKLEDFYSDEELQQIVTAYNFPYQDYKAKYADMPIGSETVVVNGTDYVAEKTTAEVYEVEHDGEKGLYTPDLGDVVYKINVPSTGKYAFSVTYYQTPGQTTMMERGFKIDDDYPFSESRFLYFPRLWVYDYDEDGNYISDKNGNDFRPTRIESAQWYTYDVRDWIGYDSAAFEFYLTEGEHELKFEGNREPMVIGKITMYPVNEKPTYTEFIDDCKANGITEVTDVEAIEIQGEKPTLLSSQTVLPTVDRTSCFNDPTDAANLLYNCLSANILNQFVVYTANVEKAGLYRIATRYRQNGLIGMFCSRKVLINGELQFEEAARCRFVYSPYWQIETLTDGTQEFLFYLEEGENEIVLETVLGDFAQYCYEVRNIADELTEVYYKIVKIAGIQPDPYRDYGFARVI